MIFNLIKNTKRIPEPKIAYENLIVCTDSRYRYKHIKITYHKPQMLTNNIFNL